MNKPFETLAQLDKLIHEPARLALLTALSACRRADFLYLQRLTGLTKGNLSSHLSRLDDAGLVAVTKTYEGKKPITYAALTDAGRDAIDQYWDRLDDVRTRVCRWSGPS